ncbi:MAG: hypothetical protein JXK07_12720 [Spirochaetes bacterium]|nr:hypothetical protein [Spirochaetota bacterium]MBN2770517.1 hypothetical protein [Spirochaetota bacterium]
MPALIETITDPAHFQKIFYDYFLKGVVYLKTANGNFKIQFLGYTEGLIALRIPIVKNMPASCVILCRIPGETIYAQLKFVEKQEDEAYILKPVKIQMISVSRNEQRHSISGKGKQLLFVSKVISDSIIERSISFDQRKAELAKLKISDQLKSVFVSKKIYFSNEGSSDDRMRYFYSRKPDYLIPDFDSIDIKDPVQLNFKNDILNKDYYIQNRRAVMSEASVAVYYREAIPFGYIQVNHNKKLDKSVLIMLKNLSMQLSKIFANVRLFKPLDENLLVSDISSKGVGIVFRERSYIRFFPEKSYVHFELILPDQIRIPMLTVVRSITFLENKIIKAGCEIISMDKSAMQIYSHYLQSL